MTRLFGVIGDPISHSLSPAMHNAALRAKHLDAVYAPFEVPRRWLAPMLRGLVLAGVEGLNVTVPLKEAAVPLMHRLDPAAQACGAVNTIVVRGGRLHGFNTDGVGFAQALRELGWRPGPVRAVILGAGGAARAVAWELGRAAGSRITIANRSRGRAVRLTRWLRRVRPQVQVGVAPLSQVPLQGATLLVNATTVGMSPRDGLLIPADALHRGLVVYDLVYHRTTRLVAEARRRGCVAANGLSMLLYQGAESFRLWWNRPAPLAVMRRALEQAIQA